MVLLCIVVGSFFPGDEYWICYDNELVSQVYDYQPAEYGELETGTVAATAPKVTMKQVQEYFVSYMDCSNVGQISNLHMAHADATSLSDPLCLQLAVLFSKAIDSAKTGELVIIPPEAHEKITQWPHYMESDYEDLHDRGKVFYKSARAIGVLYDKCVAFEKQLEEKQAIIDTKIEKEAIVVDRDMIVRGYMPFVIQAKNDFMERDQRVAAVCAKYNIEEEKEKRNFAIQSIDLSYRNAFIRSNMSQVDKQKLASAYYAVTYETVRQKEVWTGDQRITTLSFCWVVAREFLLRIKADKLAQRKNKPCASL